MNLNFSKFKALALIFSAALLQTLLADDAPSPPSTPATVPEVRILATDPTALAGTSTAAFTLVRTGTTNADLVVHYAISGTGSNGVDYAAIQDASTIPAGYLAVDILIQPQIAALSRGNKSVVLTLQTNADYTVAHHHHQRASVTIVDDFYNNIAPSVTLTSPTNGQVFIAPTDITLQADATDPDDPIQQVSFFANDDYLGKATNSPFSLVWSNAPPGHFTLFARTTDAAGKSTLSSPVEITVTNAPPTVQLLSPTNGAVFGVPANVVIQASAADTDDSVKQVQIYADGHLLGTFTASPYSLTWTNVPPGKHTVVVRATDVVGLTASASARFTVTNALPVVTLTSPQSGANLKAPALIVLNANATDADDSIRSVTFRANNRFLATVTHQPYSYDWENVKHGVYRIQAIATDSYGMKSVSAAVVISVSK